MNDYDGLIERKRGRNLFIVEGDHEKDVLIKVLINVFPELEIEADSIEIYHSNIYNLYEKLETYIESNDSLEDIDIDLPNILWSGTHKRDFRGIYLFFDYERQDTFYTSEKIEKMMIIFNEETNNGKLYINYPMVESYLDMDEWNASSYMEKAIPASINKGTGYKNEVINKWVARDITALSKVYDKVMNGSKLVQRDVRKEVTCQIADEILALDKNTDMYREDIYNILLKLLNYGVTDKVVNQISYEIHAILNKGMYFKEHESYYTYLRRVFRMLMQQNVKKAIWLGRIAGNDTKDNFRKLNEEGYMNILQRQNSESRDRATGKIYVLNTCILFVPEFKFSLIENEMIS